MWTCFLAIKAEKSPKAKMLTSRRGSRGRRGSLLAIETPKPKLMDRIFSGRSHSVTDSMIRNVVEKVHAKLGKDKEKSLIKCQAILPDGKKIEVSL